MSLFNDLSDLEYPFAGDREDEETVPQWIGPHCPVCLDDIADADVVRCFCCGKRQHKGCAVVVVEDHYCMEACALAAALEALKDASLERDEFRAGLISACSLIAKVLGGERVGHPTLEDQLIASVEVAKRRKTA